jgi:hypothetical protein
MILQPYQTLISLKMPSYERYGSVFAAPILSLFGKQTEIAIIPELWNAVMKTLIQLIQIYPVYMANYFNDANHSHLLETVYDLFAKQVKLITETRLGGERESTLTSRGGSKVQGQPQPSKKKKNNADDEDESTSGPNETDIYQLYLQGKRKFSFNEEIEAENDCFTVLVFQLIEQLLLSCSSSSLTPIFSYVMNQGIYSMLICLEKGLLTSSMTDKRLLSMKNRFNEGILSERIRYSALLQESVLSLTLANILTFHYFNIDAGTLQGIIHTQKEQQQHGNASSMNKRNGSKTITASTTTTNASQLGPSNAEYLHARYLHLNCYSMNLHKFHILCNMICHSRSAPISLHNVVMKGILTVSTMIHPISLPLPVLPVKDVMKYYDQEWKRRVETTESAAASGEQTMNKEEDHEAEEVSKKGKQNKKRPHIEDHQATAPAQGEVETSNEVTEERPQEKKRKSNEESAKKKPTKSSTAIPAQAPAAFSFTDSSKEVVDKKKKNGKKEVEKRKVEEEDDELPDLDM